MSIAMKQMQAAKTRLLVREPFFGALIVRTPLVEAEYVGIQRIDTAATDMKRIYFNPQFVETLDINECIFVLMHELMHIVGKHGYRRGSRDAKLFNKACDFFINSWLKEIGYKFLSCGLLSPKYTHRGWSVEGIYKDIVDTTTPPPQGGSGGSEPGNNDDFGGLGGDLLEPAETPGSAEAKAHEREIDGMVSAAAQMTKLAGKMSSDIERLVKDVLHPPLPWHELLAEHMSEVVKTGVDWNRRNRRFRNVIMPVTRQQNSMGTLVGIGDSSGSVTDEVLAYIASQARDCGEILEPSEFHWLWATNKIVGEQVFERGEEVVLDRPKTGGTDMRVPLARAAELDPVAVVLITDGHTPWPDREPDYPLIVVCTTDADVPIGQVVRYRPC